MLVIHRIFRLSRQFNFCKWPPRQILESFWILYIPSYLKLTLIWFETIVTFWISMLIIKMNNKKIVAILRNFFLIILSINILQFFWNILSQKSLKLFYASIYQNQNLSSSPSFCKMEKMIKIVTNQLFLFCQYLSHFTLFQRNF